VVDVVVGVATLEAAVPAKQQQRFIGVEQEEQKDELLPMLRNSSRGHVYNGKATGGLRVTSPLATDNRPEFPEWETRAGLDM
jgi:hypothetical protein